MPVGGLPFRQVKEAAVSDFKSELGFEDCWSNTRKGRSVRSPAAGSFSTGKTEADGQGRGGSRKTTAGASAAGEAGQATAPATSISAADKARLARVVRGATLVEKRKEYVEAARLIGRTPYAIMLRHILPNVLSPVLVIATISLALAIIAEATLSFLGVGAPPTQPSLGTLIRIGQGFLFSGEWWILLFPAVTLLTLALSVNLLGDWLRDALNPRLR